MHGGSIDGTDRNAVPQPMARPTAEPAGLDDSCNMTSTALRVLAYATNFYDFVLYGVFAFVLAPVSFLSQDPAFEMLGAFGAGFVVRLPRGLLTSFMADNRRLRRFRSAADINVITQRSITLNA